MAPMGDSAQAMGSGDKANLQTFVAGNWCAVGMEGVDTKHYYNFKADGTLECGGGDKVWTGTGTWKVSGDTVTLDYKTMNGKPYEDFRTEYKKGEEGGTQVAVARALVFDGVYEQLDKAKAVWVDEDKKHLTFEAPQPAAQPGGDAAALGDLLKKTSFRLERMGAKKE